MPRHGEKAIPRYGNQSNDQRIPLFHVRHYRKIAKL